MSSKDTIKFGYASSKNVTFRGEVGSDITREEWAAMSDEEQAQEIEEVAAELVEIWVVEE